jgi:hypothetical protein
VFTLQSSFANNIKMERIEKTKSKLSMQNKKPRNMVLTWRKWSKNMVRVIAKFLLSRSSVEKVNRAKVQSRDWHNNCWQILRSSQTWIRHISSFLHIRRWINLVLLCCLLTLQRDKKSSILIGLFLRQLTQPLKNSWFSISTKQAWEMSKIFWRIAWETSSRVKTNIWLWLIPWLMLSTSNELSVKSQELKLIRTRWIRLHLKQVWFFTNGEIIKKFP